MLSHGLPYAYDKRRHDQSINQSMIIPAGRSCAVEVRLSLSLSVHVCWRLLMGLIGLCTIWLHAWEPRPRFGWVESGTAMYA